MAGTDDDEVIAGCGPTVTATVSVPVQPFAAVPVTVYVVVDAGVVVTLAPFRLPGIQLYVEAPFEVSVTLLPTQTDELDAEAVIDGDVFTVMVRVAVPVHPFTAVPVTVYVVVVVGETVTGDPLRLPGIHPYVDAPVPVRVVELPEQMVAPLVVVPTVGEVFTVMVRVAVALHPVLVPVTV